MGKVPSKTIIKVSLRKARLADLPLLVTLEREFDHDERQAVLKESPKIKPYLRTTSAQFSINRMKKWIRARNARVMIAEAGGVPCGFSVAWIGASPAIYRPKQYGFVGIMFVKRLYRGRRVSSLMMKDANSWFGDRNIRYVCLSVMSDNRHARQIYEKWGFHYFFSVMWKTGLK